MQVIDTTASVLTTGSWTVTFANSSRCFCGNVSCRWVQAKTAAVQSAIFHNMRGCWMRLQPPCTQLHSSRPVVHSFVSEFKTWLLAIVRCQSTLIQQPNKGERLQNKTLKRETNLRPTFATRLNSLKHNRCLTDLKSVFYIENIDYTVLIFARIKEQCFYFVCYTRRVFGETQLNLTQPPPDKIAVVVLKTYIFDVTVGQFVCGLITTNL